MGGYWGFFVGVGRCVVFGDVMLFCCCGLCIMWWYVLLYVMMGWFVCCM